MGINSITHVSDCDAEINSITHVSDTEGTAHVSDGTRRKG